MLVKRCRHRAPEFDRRRLNLVDMPAASSNVRYHKGWGNLARSLAELHYIHVTRRTTNGPAPLAIFLLCGPAEWKACL